MPQPGGLDREFAVRDQAKGDLVFHRTGDPAIFCNPRKGSEAHASGLTNAIKNARHHTDAANLVDVPINRIEFWGVGFKIMEVRTV